MLMRDRRRQLIATLLSGGAVQNQEELSRLLARRGVRVNQATLSRDLRDLGVFKGPSGYVLATNGAAPVPAAIVPPGSSPIDAFAAVRPFVLSASAAGNLVVLRTRPGNASPLATELDRLPLEGMLGTIAGDDTVFLAAQSARHASRLASRLTAGWNMDTR